MTTAATPSVGPTGRLVCAHPARALLARLNQAKGEAPLWAPYLPPQLRKEASSPNTASSGALSWSRSSSETSCEDVWWRGQVWTLSQDPQGCRQIQKVLDEVNSAKKLQLALELRGHVMSALRCPQANFVLQKLIMVLQPAEYQFVIDELLRKGPHSVVQAARHKYGCRIVQRIFDRSPLTQVRGLLDGLMTDAAATCIHPFGNYVMQYILEQGPGEYRGQILQALKESTASLSADAHTVAVLLRALRCGEHGDKVALSRALQQRPELLANMQRLRHGNVVGNIVMSVPPDEELPGSAARPETAPLSLPISKRVHTLSVDSPASGDTPVSPCRSPCDFGGA